MIGPFRTRPDTKAFRELLVILARYERKFLRRRFLSTDNEFAEGYRAMLDILSTGLDCYVHNSTSDPRFVSLVSPIRKMGGDNADARYFFAPLRSERTYTIRGTMGGAIYVGFTLYGGLDPKEFHIVANASTPEVQVAEDGTFEVRVTGQPRGPNDLRTDPTTNCIIIRRYYLDEEAIDANPGEQSITPSDAPTAPALLDGEEMARQLRLLGSFLEGWFRLTPMPMPPIPIAYNRLTPPRAASTDTGHWSTPDNAHSFGLYRLKKDEALVLRGRSPECVYWSVQLWNPYLQTFDYSNHPCALNCREVVLDADGGFTLYVAHRDPGKGNWLSTAGHPRGFVYFRWLKARAVPSAIAAKVQKIGPA